MKALASFWLALWLAATQCAQAQGAVSPAAVPTNTYPVHSVLFAGGVTGLPDLIYASYVRYRPLSLDLYLPPARIRSAPLILFIHGGSLKAGGARTAIGIPDLPMKLATLAARGYVVAGVNYRLRDEARFPAQVQDVKAAIVYLRTNAARYRIDPDRAVVWGLSSGGQLAALVAMSCGKPQFEPPESDGNPLLPEIPASRGARVSDCVQGTVSWYGDLQLSQEANDADVAAVLGCQPCAAPDIAVADPMSFASAEAPPMLIIHGTADSEVSITQSQAMASRLAELHVPVETLYIPDVDHGFIGRTPKATAAAHQQAFERTLAFIDALFRGVRTHRLATLALGGPGHGSSDAR